MVAKFDERVLQDSWWPVLGQRLDAAQGAGTDVGAALRAAITAGPLTDDLPAAALWSRLAPTASRKPMSGVLLEWLYPRTPRPLSVPGPHA